VLAVTGALKTVLARLLVYQLARRGDTVIVLDPKGDKGLEQVCRDVVLRLGEPERFARFHAAFPEASFRFDALANWDRDTQVASRIRLLMGGAPEDPFNAFVWTTVTDIVRAMKRLGRRVTLQSLLDTVRSQDTAEALAEEVLRAWFDEADRAPFAAPVPEPHHELPRSAPRRPPGPRQSAFVNPRLAHWVDRFRAEVPPARRPSDITGLLASLEADRGWFAKMVVGLTPVLMRLTAGDLGPLLSPDPLDFEDPRPIHTTRQLIDGRRVVYFGFDALSDPSVAEGLAALVLSDLAATAGDLYNHGQEGGRPPRRIHVLCDEWGDLVCEPVVQLANKGRGAGVVLYLFGQTLADLVVKLGDEARAKRILGNMNNFIVGATSDADTLDYLTRKLGDTTVRRTTLSQGSGQKTEDTGLEYAATRQASVTEQTLELVPPQVLAGLPDLHYIALLNRAQVYKGRIPVLHFDPQAASQ
jgi:conjugal transfer pilus assembly protein TraD